MKLKRILLIMVSITMFSCNNSDCSNGIQDGNETGIDCGGDCVNCTTNPPALETQLSGDWHLHYTVQQNTQDTTYSNLGPECKLELTLTELTPGYYVAYGTVGSCGYTQAYESSWHIDEDGLFNGSLTIDLLSSDSLYLSQDATLATYAYYR